MFWGVVTFSNFFLPWGSLSPYPKEESSKFSSTCNIYWWHQTRGIGDWEPSGIPHLLLLLWAHWFSFPIKFRLRAVLGWVPLTTMEGVRGEWFRSLWPHAFLGLGILSLWLNDIERVEVMNRFLLLDIWYSPRCLFLCKPTPSAWYSFYVPPHPSNIFSFHWRKQSQFSVPCHQKGGLLTLAVHKTLWV